MVVVRGGAWSGRGRGEGARTEHSTRPESVYALRKTRIEKVSEVTCSAWNRDREAHRKE